MDKRTRVLLFTSLLILHYTYDARHTVVNDPKDRFQKQGQIDKPTTGSQASYRYSAIHPIE